MSSRVAPEPLGCPPSSGTGRPLISASVRGDTLPGTPGVARTAILAVRIAAVLIIAAGLVAAIVRLFFAEAARQWLAFSFTGLPARPAVAAAIFLHNLRALAAVGGLLLVAQSPHWASRPSGVIHRQVQRIGEAVLGAAIAANVIVVGASFGAYGMRMIRAALPHGPFELASCALALALYLHGRHRSLPIRHMVAVAALCVGLLALAAALETYVNI